MQYYPEIRAFFKAKARGKPIKVARPLVALEPARIVYCALTRQQEFQRHLQPQTGVTRLIGKLGVVP